MTKVSVHLCDTDLAALKEIADQRQLSYAQAIRQAILTERFVMSEARSGAKVLIARDGQVRELVLR